MENSNIDYNTKLDNLIKNIKINNKKKEDKPVKKNIKITNEKDFYCKQLDSLNYCLEMHKVRQNKKADFDIHNTLKYNIDDDIIGKNVVYDSWKEVHNDEKNTIIEEFIQDLIKKYDLEYNYTKDFVNHNIKKIKYDKYNKKISSIYNMIVYEENNNKLLKIKINNKNNSNNIQKMRKSLKNKFN